MFIILVYLRYLIFTVIGGGDKINGFEFCRKRAGLTQIEAATAIGVTQGTISMWENGRTYPVGERLKIVIAVYGCTYDELFQYQESY